MFFFRKKPREQFGTGAQNLSVPEQNSRDCRCFIGYAISDVGCVRDNNEDNYILDLQMNRKSADHSEHFLAAEAGDNEWHFAGVFDGMGGGDKGEVAARVAAELFAERIRTLKRNVSREHIDEALRNAFLKSNNEIVEMQKRYRIYGTTGTVACIGGNEFKIYHLGDSRAYLMRSGELFRLTRDQTLAQMKIDTGAYDWDDPRAEAEKHKLTEYIGRDWTEENIRPVESEWITVLPGDRLLLCSDGLYDMCSDEQIAGNLGVGAEAAAAARTLNREALLSGGEDNTTCIVIIFS